MQSDSSGAPGPDFMHKGVSHIVVVPVAFPDLDGQGAAQHSGHASHNGLQLALRLLEQ